MNAKYLEEKTGGKVVGKTGSITALPIIETQAGDVSAFVPTNVISITDGQIYLESELFNSGQRPAVNSGLSVSRVGGAAQTKIIKKLGGGVRLASAQFRELEAFSQFASDLDDSTRKQLERGKRIMVLMRQNQYSPLSVSEMSFSLFALDEGYFDDVDVKHVLTFEKQMHNYCKEHHSQLLNNIEEKPELTSALAKEMREALDAFKKVFVPSTDI